MSFTCQSWFSTIQTDLQGQHGVDQLFEFRWRSRMLRLRTYWKVGSRAGLSAPTRGYGVRRVLIPLMWYGTRQGSPFNREMSQASLFASISDFETSQNVISIAIIMNRNFLNKMGSLELCGIATCLSNGTPKNFSVTVLPFPSFWVGGYGQQTLQDLTHRRRVHRSLCLPGSSTLQGSSVWKGLEVLRCPSSTFKSSNVCCCRVAPLSLFEFSKFFVDDPRNNSCDKCMRWISSICVYYKSIFNWTYT